MARKCKIEKTASAWRWSRLEEEAASGPDAWRALEDPFPALELEPA
jgi:hypothetical protein